jgi:hypothetical protein
VPSASKISHGASGMGSPVRNISRIGLRETGLQKAESEAIPEQRSQVTEATRTFVLLQTGVRIDLGESRVGSRVAQRQSQAGVPDELIDARYKPQPDSARDCLPAHCALMPPEAVFNEQSRERDRRAGTSGVGHPVVLAAPECAGRNREG